MSGSKKKKSILKSRFYQIYFGLVLLALIAIAVGTAWLNGMLKDYESAQPVYVAMDAAKLFEDSDYDALYALDTSAQEVSEGDKAFYVSSMRALAQGKDVAWSEAFSPDANERKYNVTLDGERFATFTLVPSGQKTAKGNALWMLDSVTTHVTLRQPTPTPEPEPTPTPEPDARTYQCRITAPRGYRVSVDGVELDAAIAQTTEKDLFDPGFLPDGVSSPVLVEYLYTTANEAPAITAVDEAGQPVDVEQSGDKSLTWSCSPRQDESYQQRFGKSACRLGLQVAKFISKDAKKTLILKACAKDSPAAEIFKSLTNSFATPHSSSSSRNERAFDFFVLSDQCFTCRVTFDYVLQTSKGEYVYPTDYTFCVVHNDTTARLYNILIS